MKQVLQIRLKSGVGRNGTSAYTDAVQSILLRLANKTFRMSVNNDAFITPVSLPGKSTLPLNGLRVLAGDIGGTKTNLALYHASRNKLELIAEARFASTEYDSVSVMIKDFVSANSQEMPDRICLGVAGPVLDGKAELTNLDWFLDSDLLIDANSKFVRDAIARSRSLCVSAFGCVHPKSLIHGTVPRRSTP